MLDIQNRTSTEPIAESRDLLRQLSHAFLPVHIFDADGNALRQKDRIQKRRRHFRMRRRGLNVMCIHKGTKVPKLPCKLGSIIGGSESIEPGQVEGNKSKMLWEPPLQHISHTFPMTDHLRSRGAGPFKNARMALQRCVEFGAEPASGGANGSDGKSFHN